MKSIPGHKANFDGWKETDGWETLDTGLTATVMSIKERRTRRGSTSGGSSSHHHNAEIEGPPNHPARFHDAKRPVMTNIDLKLLAIIDVLHKTRSVSQTAENLQLSQSTISMSLARLRRHFNDPLFVRTSAGMEPTPHAVEIIDLLKKAEGLLQSALECQHAVFDPATSHRTLRLCSTDIAQVTLMPAIVKRLKQVAPGIKVDLTLISDRSARLLESGEIDLVVGFIPPMGAGFYQQRLFKDRFVCAVRAAHPRIKDQVTLEQLQREAHVAIEMSGTGHGVLDRVLESKHIQRRIGMRIPSFLGIGPILMATELVAILPEQLAQFFAEHGRLKLLPLPFSVPPYYITQHWHERYKNDPANIWFRGMIADLFLK